MRVRSVAASGCLRDCPCAWRGRLWRQRQQQHAAAAAAVVAPPPLTIYSSLPLQGDSRPQSTDVVNGEKLALEEAGGKVGKYKIKYKSLDDSTAAAGKWEPGQTSADARKAAQDQSTIVYLGEFNSGASAISIPILNEAGILQVSPSNTYVGLTRSEGADKGEPDKYYPSGKRTFGRVVPADHIQAAAQVDLPEGRGLHEDLHPERQGGLREGHRRRRSPNIAKAQGLQIARQRRHRHQGRQLPLAGHEDQVGRRGLHVLRRHHPEQGRPALHRRQRRQPDGEALRPGRHGRAGVLRRRPARPSRR